MTSINTMKLVRVLIFSIIKHKWFCLYLRPSFNVIVCCLFFRYDVNNAIIKPNNNDNFHEVHVRPSYQYLYLYLEKNQELNQIFNKAMALSGPLEMKRVLYIKDLRAFQHCWLKMNTLKQIISEYPSIKGINWDKMYQLGRWRMWEIFKKLSLTFAKTQNGDCFGLYNSRGTKPKQYV